MATEAAGETREVELKRAFRKARMSPRAHRVCYVLLYDLAQWKTGVIREERQPKSAAALARKCDMSEATLRRALAELEDLGWLIRIPNPGRGNTPRYQVQPGRDAPKRDGAAMTTAERSRNYRARKASQDPVTHHEPVSGFGASPTRKGDVIRHATSRDEFAGQGRCTAEGLGRDEGVGVGMLAETKTLTLRIAGRTHAAEVCKGCGERVPSRFAPEGRHVWCGDQRSPFATGAEVIPIRGAAA